MLAKLWWRLVRFGFRLLYNELAFTYDWVSTIVSLGDWRSWQRASLQFLPPNFAGLILEVAHGTGNLQLDLHQQGYHSIGYDLSPFMGKIAQNKLQKAGISPILARGMAQGLPFASAAFDTIICTFPTNFILQDATLREFHRVLKPQGQLLIVFNGVLVAGGLLKRFLDWLYTITGQKSNGDNHAFDATAYFRNFGFSAELKEVPCSKSLAQVLVAQKTL